MEGVEIFYIYWCVSVCVHVEGRGKVSVWQPDEDWLLGEHGEPSVTHQYLCTASCLEHRDPKCICLLPKIKQSKRSTKARDQTKCVRSQSKHSVLLMPTHALSEEDWIMLLGYCWEPCKPQMKLELSQGCSTVCTISLASLQVREIRIADYSVLGQHSVNFPLASLSWAQETTLVKRCCTGRKRHLGSSKQGIHEWFAEGTKRYSMY